MMVRSFVSLLLLVIVFLVGMVIGADREQDVIPVNNKQQEESEFTEEKVQLENDADITTEDGEPLFIEDQEMEEQTASVDQSGHSTLKIASFLESIVTGFYNIIVDILYQISSLFF